MPTENSIILSDEIKDTADRDDPATTAETGTDTPAVTEGEEVVSEDAVTAPDAAKNSDTSTTETVADPDAAAAAEKDKKIAEEVGSALYTILESGGDVEKLEVEECKKLFTALNLEFSSKKTLFQTIASLRRLGKYEQRAGKINAAILFAIKTHGGELRKTIDDATFNKFLAHLDGYYHNSNTVASVQSGIDSFGDNERVREEERKAFEEQRSAYDRIRAQYLSPEDIVSFDKKYADQSTAKSIAAIRAKINEALEMNRKYERIEKRGDSLSKEHVQALESLKAMLDAEESGEKDGKIMTTLLSLFKQAKERGEESSSKSANFVMNTLVPEVAKLLPEDKQAELMEKVGELCTSKDFGDMGTSNKTKEFIRIVFDVLWGVMPDPVMSIFESILK